MAAQQAAVWRPVPIAVVVCFRAMLGLGVLPAGFMSQCRRRDGYDLFSSVGLAWR